MHRGEIFVLQLQHVLYTLDPLFYPLSQPQALLTACMHPDGVASILGSLISLPLIYILCKTSTYPAMSNCVQRCSSRCRQSQLNEVICLKNALVNPATVVAMTNFLCIYDRFMASDNKVVILRAIGDLQVVSGCQLDSLVGIETTSEELSADVNGVLQYFLSSIYDIVRPLNIGEYIVPGCGQVKSLLTKVSRVVFVYGVPRFNGLIQANKMNVVSRFLALVNVLNPDVFHALLEVLVGRGSLARELALSLSGLTEMVSKTVGDTSRILHRTTEMLTKTGGLLQNTGSAGLVRGPKGLLNTVTRLVPPLRGLVNGVVDTFDNTLQGVTNVLGGTNGEFQIARGLTGNLGDDILGYNLLRGVLGENELTNGLPNTATRLATGLLGGVSGGSGNGSKDGILGPDLLGVSEKNALTRVLNTATGLAPYILGEISGGSESESKDSILGGSGGLASILTLGKISGNIGKSVGISASGSVDVGLGSPISNTAIPGESPTENGFLNGAGGSVPGQRFPRTHFEK